MDTTRAQAAIQQLVYKTLEDIRRIQHQIKTLDEERESLVALEAEKQRLHSELNQTLDKARHV